MIRGNYTEIFFFIDFLPFLEVILDILKNDLRQKLEWNRPVQNNLHSLEEKIVIILLLFFHDFGIILMNLYQ